MLNWEKFKYSSIVCNWILNILNRKVKMGNIENAKKKVDELLNKEGEASFDEIWEFVRWNEITHKEEYELWDYWLRKWRSKS